MKHIAYACHCDKEFCHYCVGGLFTCTVCGASEGELTTECCGRKMTEEELALAYAGNLDFNANTWWKRGNHEPS